MKYVASVVFTLSIITKSAFAQEVARQTLPSDTPIPALMIFTLSAGLFVAVASFAYFLRKRSNRDATAKGLGLSEDKSSSRRRG